MSRRTIELIYFDGCPNAEKARDHLRAVPGPRSWTEWNLSSPETPERFRRHGSPTVLVDDEDIRGEMDGNAAMACRADGAPSPELIRQVLSGDG